MGAQQSKPNHVVVDMSKGLGCQTFRIYDGPMDPRLAPFMTADDYQRKMDAVNKLMHERSPFRFKVCGPFWAYFVVAVAFFATMMIIFYRLATTECREPNGMCPTSRTDATDGQCCNFWCCSSEFDEFLVNASTSFLNQKCVWYPEPGKSQCQVGDDAGRGLESCGVAYECNKENGECASPYGYVCRKIKQGELENVPSVQWPATLCVLFLIPLVLFIPYYSSYGCRITEHVVAEFADWQRLGIQVSFYPGSKNRAPRLTFIPHYVPQQPPGQMGNIQMGQVVQPAATQFTVTVPQGTPSGSTLLVQSPDGKQVQVSVPPAAVPGSTFVVSV